MSHRSHYIEDHKERLYPSHHHYNVDGWGNPILPPVYRYHQVRRHNLGTQPDKRFIQDTTDYQGTFTQARDNQGLFHTYWQPGLHSIREQPGEHEPYKSDAMNELHRINNLYHKAKHPFSSKEMRALERINAENRHLLPDELLNEISSYIPAPKAFPHLPNEILNKIDTYVGEVRRPELPYKAPTPKKRYRRSFNTGRAFNDSIMKWPEIHIPYGA